MPSDEPTRSGDDMDRLVDEILTEHKSIAKAQRQQKLRQMGHRCQLRGCLDNTQGGQAQVLVQRVEDNPDHCDPDDLQNLTTSCIRCARWMSRIPTRDDLPHTIKQRLNGVEPDSDQVAILDYVYKNGPAAPRELLELIEGDHRKLHSKLDELRSLDATTPAISEPVLVKNRLESVYGLPEQIPPSQRARGQIPLDPDERRSRILDAFALRLDEVLPDGEMKRERIATAVDRSVPNIYLMLRRAQADQFPLEEWADAHTSRRHDVSVTEAIDLIAKSTTNLSRQLVGDAVADVLEQNDEQQLANVVRDWTRGDRKTVSTGDTDVTNRDDSRTASGDAAVDTETAERSNSQTAIVTEDDITRLDDDLRWNR